MAAGVDASSKISSNPGSSKLSTQHSPSKNSSSDPSTTSSFFAGPRYHFNGAGVTQSQSQFSPPVVDDDSQKKSAISSESAAMLGLPLPLPVSVEESSGAAAKGSSTRTAPRSSNIMSTNSIQQHVSSDTSKPNLIPLSHTTLNVSPTKPPPRTPSRPPVSRDKFAPKRQSPPRIRSSSPASQDSFIGSGIREDPEKAFLAANRQFDVPLSELGREGTQDASPSVHRSQDSSYAVMQALTQHDHPQSPPSPSWQAQATPSKPDESQSQSSPHLYDDSQESDIGPRAQDTSRYSPGLASQASTPPIMSTEASSSDELYGYPDHVEPATQPMDCEPTQAATSEELNFPGATNDPTSGYAESSAVPGPSNWFSEASSRPSTTGARSLAATNNKPWRRVPAFRAPAAPHVEPQVPDGSDGYTQLPDNASTAAASARAADELYAHILSNASRSAQTATEPQVAMRSVDNSPDARFTDVVPDSEPNRTQITRASPSNSPSVVVHEPVRSAASSRLTPPRESEEESEEEDDDDDVPLASIAPRSRPRKRQRIASPSDETPARPLPKSKVSHLPCIWTVCSFSSL